MPTATADHTDAIHVWEARGLGKAPFHLVAVLSQPPKSLNEHNPAGFNHAWAELHHQKTAYPGLDCLTICDVCGTCITNTYVVRDATGKHLGVGCDCIEKAGDAGMTTKVKIMKKEAARAKKQAAMKAKWEAERPIREARQLELEQAEAERAERERLARAKFAEKNRWLLEVLDCHNHTPDGFVDSMIKKIETSEIGSLSERCLNILEDIYGKHHGRSGSKAYEAAAEEFRSKV